MPRQPSTETQLKTARADLRRLNLELARANQQTSEWRGRATKAEQEAAEWKRRFDLLLHNVRATEIGQHRYRIAANGVLVGGEVHAWQHEEDPARVISAIQKTNAVRDGGASASSVKAYSVALTLGVGASEPPNEWKPEHLMPLPDLPADTSNVKASTRTRRVTPCDGGRPVAWRVRGYAQFKTGMPGPWRYFDGAERPKVNDPSDCDMEPLFIAAGPPGMSNDQPKEPK